MTKAKLKQNITKINKLLRSDNYEAGIELLKTFDDPEITKGTAKTIMAKIKKLLTQYDYDSIDQGTGIVQLLSDRINFEELLNGCSVTVTGYLEPNKIFSGTKPAQPYLNYALVNTIALLNNTIKPDSSIKIDNISELRHLWHESHFNDSEYGKFPIGLTKFTNLRILDLGAHKLKSIPDEISRLSKLQVLKLDINELEILPESIFGLSNLEELNMSYCSGSKQLVTKIPESIINLKKLKKLNIGSMKKLSFEETIETISGISSLTELSISANSIKTIPDNIEKIQGIEYLDLSSNYNLVPEDTHKLRKISSLKMVDLSYSINFSEQDKETIKQKLTGIKVKF